MDKMPILSILLQSIPEAMILVFLSLSLYGFQDRISLKRIAFVGVLFGTSSYFVRMLPFPFGVHTLIQIIIMTFFNTLVFKITFKKSLMAILTGTIILGLVESLFLLLVPMIMGISVHEILADKLLRIVIPWFHLSILLSMAVILYKKRILLGILDNLEKRNNKHVFWITVLFVLFFAFIFSFLAMYTLIESVVPKWDIHRNLRIIITFLSVFALVAFLMLMVKKLLALAELEVTVDSQQAMITNLNNLFVSIRTQRHDFIHHLQVIYSLLESNQNQEGMLYLQNLLGEVKEINEVVEVNNPAVSALLRAKKAVAEAKGIYLKLDIECRLDKLRVPALHIVTILANLIDNALEAVEKLENNYRICRISISEFPSFFVFKINNAKPVIQEEIMDKIFKENFTTKDSYHSGLGLFTAKKLTEKYKGEIGVTSNPEEGTTFTVVIPF